MLMIQARSFNVRKAFLCLALIASLVSVSCRGEVDSFGDLLPFPDSQGLRTPAPHVMGGYNLKGPNRYLFGVAGFKSRSWVAVSLVASEADMCTLALLRLPNPAFECLIGKVPYTVASISITPDDEKILGVLSQPGADNLNRWQLFTFDIVKKSIERIGPVFDNPVGFASMSPDRSKIVFWSDDLRPSGAKTATINHRLYEMTIATSEVRPFCKENILFAGSGTTSYASENTVWVNGYYPYSRVAADPSYFQKTKGREGYKFVRGCETVNDPEFPDRKNLNQIQVVSDDVLLFEAEDGQEWIYLTNSKGQTIERISQTFRGAVANVSTTISYGKFIVQIKQIRDPNLPDRRFELVWRNPENAEWRHLPVTFSP